MELETRRTILRPWRPEDAEDLYACASDERVGLAADWPPHRSVEESRTVIRDLFSAPETWAVVLRETGRPAGCVGLLFGGAGHVPLADGEAEAGYWIGVPWWGRGLIPEALAALLRHAFDDLGLSAVYCCSFPENVASQRVQEKCGFRFLRTETGEDGRAFRVAVLTRGEVRLLSAD
ncbi:MAG: GNAT family N-acetyltransferase [Alistipes sp.]|nr:GNAT family N-acetyltransferase [Alistipes sp.]